MCRDVSVNPDVDCAEVHNAATTISPAVQIIGIVVLVMVLAMLTFVIVHHTKKAQRAIKRDDSKIYIPDQDDEGKPLGS